MAWDSFASAPQIAELDDLAQKRRSGVSIKDCNEDWCCPKCKRVFPPTKNLLVNLPHYGCASCQTKNSTVHNWSIPDTVLQGVPLDFMLYDQENTRYCVMYASVAAMDCARRVRGAMCGVSKCAPFDVPGALRAYAQKTGFECGREPTGCTYGLGNTFPLVLTFLKSHGVPYSGGLFDPPGSLGCLRLKDYFMVPKDTSLMKRLIGSGYPLLAGVSTGALFKLVDNNMKVHTYPGADGHAVLLIGTGIGRNRKGELETYFFTRAGGHAHSDYQNQGLGGDMFIWESDVDNVWGFRLEDEKLEPEDVEPEDDDEDYDEDDDED